MTLGSVRRGRGGTSEGCGVGGQDCDWGWWGVGSGGCPTRREGGGGETMNLIEQMMDAKDLDTRVHLTDETGWGSS